MDTNVQDTSLDVYHDEIKSTLTERHSAVLTRMKDFKDVTNNELAQSLGWQINRVTPRIFELREMGLVLESQRRQDSLTGRRSIAWKLAPEKTT